MNTEFWFSSGNTEISLPNSKTKQTFKIRTKQDKTIEKVIGGREGSISKQTVPIPINVNWISFWPDDYKQWRRRRGGFNHFITTDIKEDQENEKY